METGLYYNRFRYYNPETGLYISQDPIKLEGNNPNFYAYVHDSNAWVDPFGLSKSENSVGNSKFILKEKSKLQAKSKYKKPSQYKKLEEQTMKNPSKIIHQSDGRIKYERNYDRVIGSRGEKGHITIYDPIKNKIITSYPAHL